MTDQLFTGSYPSTFEAEAKQLRAENQEFALQVLAANGQAEEAYQAQLSAESAASWANIKAEQAINEAKALWIAATDALHKLEQSRFSNAEHEQAKDILRKATTAPQIAKSDPDKGQAPETP